MSKRLIKNEVVLIIVLLFELLSLYLRLQFHEKWKILVRQCWKLLNVSGG